MERLALETLKKWKTNSNKKPLIIKGARQVGKTWIMKEFGEKYYQSVAYINFDGNEKMKNLFELDYDIERIISGLELESGIPIEKQKTLIIFDEVQEVPKALSSLKYFYEEQPDYHIVAAGSLLGVALHEGTSFPVGKVDFLELYPLDFKEFLMATGNQKYLNLIEKQNFDLLESFKNKVIELLKIYFIVGGMPEVVFNYTQNKNILETREIQNKILASYEQDFSKHAPNNIVPRIKMLWNSIPSQLAKENKKFIYGLIRQGSRAKDYELALSWLIDCGLIYKVTRVNKPGIPLKHYEDISAFKLFVLDIGLLNAMSELDPKIVLEGNKLFEEFKGSCTEQYVSQQLIASDIGIYYFTNDLSKGEIDFIINYNGMVIPIEVKSSNNLNSRSLSSFVSKYDIKKAVKFSLGSYKQNEIVINIPLYSANYLINIINGNS